MLSSKLCNESDFTTEWFANACIKLKEPFGYKRKLWEWCYIYQALLERGVLAPGRNGLGFGVGKEPLASVFASHGSRVTATDLDYSNAQAQGWVSTDQHANQLKDLNERGICDPAAFSRLAKFEIANMNHISPAYYEQFDFTWSSCSFEHCGSLELGKLFILNQMNCLKPGGVAIHTTEFNLSSNDQTWDQNFLVLFRLQDIEWMVRTLREQGHRISINYSVGTGPIESYVDLPPYVQEPHLRLKIAQFITTSVGLIIHKAE